jgi:hypothetical protein
MNDDSRTIGFHIIGPLPCLDKHEIEDLQIMGCGISFSIQMGEADEKG